MGYEFNHQFAGASLAERLEMMARDRQAQTAALREWAANLKPMSAERREEALAKLAEIRAMTPKGVKQTPAEILVREDRDGYRW